MRPPVTSTGRVYASPRARRLAEERGLSLAGLVGSGTGGYVVADDVVAASRAEHHGEPPEVDAAARMRRAIAAAMSRSKREIPHYYVSHTADLTAALSWLEAENARRQVSERLLAGVLFVRATALALQKIRALNAHFHGDAAQPCDDVHVGLAVSVRSGGLVAPAIFHADALSLEALSRAFKDAVTRARSGRLRSSDMAMATITVTSLGERGVETVFPVIVPPQVAMVGFGSLRKRPWVVEDEVRVRSLVNVTLAADHRVTDGHLGARFLATLCAILEEPPA